MAMVNLTRVEVLNNPSAFLDPLSFEITFEVFGPLEEDLEFKVIYVGSPESEKHDQVLESVMVGPVPVGVNKFVLEADPPNAQLIPPDNVLEVTIVFLTVSYREREFVRVGYYSYTHYADEALRDEPPPTLRFELLQRSLLANEPRVTRYTIPWDMPEDPLAPPGENDISLPFKAEALASGFGGLAGERPAEASAAAAKQAASLAADALQQAAPMVLEGALVPSDGEMCVALNLGSFGAPGTYVAMWAPATADASIGKVSKGENTAPAWWVERCTLYNILYAVCVVMSSYKDEGTKDSRQTLRCKHCPTDRTGS
ncbi:ASF1 anti-silencing function 1 [Cladochytrium tenue]|nr:ASF1 anti-silencing function 1 [Cladochytrium tenue]